MTAFTDYLLNSPEVADPVKESAYIPVLDGGVFKHARRSQLVSNKILRNLRLAGARARFNNPRFNDVMTTPPVFTAAFKWTANTAVLINQYTVNGTNRYIATQAGTTAASGGPTGTGAGIVDNTVIWNFVDNLHTASFSTAAENSYLWLAGGGARKDVFNYFGGILTNNPGGGVNYAHMMSATVNGVLASGVARYEFVADSAKFVIRVSEAGTTGQYRLIVDNRFVSLNTLTPPHAGFNYLVVDFTSAGGRKPRNIILETGGSCSFGGVDVLITEGIYKSGGDAIIKAAITGDSYAASGGVTNPSDGWQILLGDLMGIRNIESTAIGGTGLLVASSSGTAITRISDITNFAPDVIFCALGGNDITFTPTQIQTALVSYLQALRANANTANSVMFVFGIMRGNYSPNMTAAIAAEQALAAAVAQLADPLIFFIPVATDPNGQWMTGTSNDLAPNGSGNSDLYVTGSDGVHPSALGHAFLAGRTTDATQRAINPY